MSRSKNPAAYADIAQKTFLFTGIPPEQTAALLNTDGVIVAHYESGERIRSRDDAESYLGILLYGEAAVEKRSGDSRMLMSVLSAGDLFGAAGMFGATGDYVADIVAAKSAWVLHIPEAALIRMLRADFRIVENYLRYLTARIRFLSGRIDGLAQPNVADRVYAYLADNAANGVFSPDYPLTALADALCVSRATLYRALDALSEQGKIRRDRKTIALLEEI